MMLLWISERREKSQIWRSTYIRHNEVPFWLPRLVIRYEMAFLSASNTWKQACEAVLWYQGQQSSNCHRHKIPKQAFNPTTIKLVIMFPLNHLKWALWAHTELVKLHFYVITSLAELPLELTHSLQRDCCCIFIDGKEHLESLFLKKWPGLKKENRKKNCLPDR